MVVVRRNVPWRSLRLASLGVTGSVLAAALAACGASDGSVAASAPACARIAGEELARDGRWRVVRTGDDAHPERLAPVVACRVDRRGPARVRVLGRSQGTDDEGARVGDQSIDVEGFGGGRVVIVTTDSGDDADTESATTERGTYTLIDLDRGRASRLPGGRLLQTGAGGDALADTDLAVQLTKNGSVLWWTLRDATSDRPRAGGFTRWDAAGISPLEGVTEAVATEPAGSFYLRRSDGRAARIALTGAAQLPHGTTPSLAWRTLRLPATSRAEVAADASSGFNLQPLGSDTSDGDGPWLNWSGRGSRDPASVLTISWAAGAVDGDSGTIATLAGRGQSARRALRQLGSAPRAALLSGRFADRPSERRLRLISHNAAAARFFDRRATASMERQGHAAISAGWVSTTLRVAVIDGDRVLLWGPRGGRERTIPGANALAAGDGGFYLTDAAGRTRFLRT